MDLVALKAELTTDPLIRNYAAMDDVAAAKRLNVVDRPGPSSVAGILNYFLVNKYRTNTGTDTVGTSMLGRLIVAAGTAVGVSPFGATGTLSLDQKCSVAAMLEIVRNPNIATLPYQSSTLQILLDDLVTAGVMKNADKTAIIAMSDNVISRAAELGFGHVTESNVADARRLP